MPKIIKAPRYGKTVRDRYNEAVRKAKATYECPRCRMKRVRQVMAGIWRCRKCGATFTGGAWIPRTDMGSERRVLPPSAK